MRVIGEESHEMNMQGGVWFNGNSKRRKRDDDRMCTRSCSLSIHLCGGYRIFNLGGFVYIGMDLSPFLYFHLQ